MSKEEEYKAALQKVLDDTEVGVVPASHIAHIKRLLGVQPKVFWINECIEKQFIDAYTSEDRALSNTEDRSLDFDLMAEPFIQLTPEVKAALRKARVGYE